MPMRRPLFLFFLLFASITQAQQVVSKQTASGTFRFVNKQTGLPVDDMVWDETEPFINGFSRVLSGEHFSFVDMNGKLICPVQFESARNFSGKLAAVKKDGLWGFINESGKPVIPFEYSLVYDFSEPVTAVMKENKWFLIDSKTAVAKPLDISAFYGFKNGIATIERNGRIGTINTSGAISMTNEPVKAPAFQPLNTSRIAAAPTSSLCPENIDFENGSFFNWKCFIGSVDSVGSTNVITVAPSAPTNNRHTLYSRRNPSLLDAYGLFPTNPPDGSNFAVKLGNTKIGAQAERIQYAIHVPANDSNFAIRYDYAVVFEDPGHTSWTQPRFTARLFDSAANAYVQCASFEYISTSSLPGFYKSTVDTTVMCKPWSSVFVSLRGYAGKTMFLEFTTADCVRKGHWGYAYVDVEKACNQNVQVQYECNFPNTTTLAAPPGFQTYNWWNPGFSTLLGTGQNVVLNPGPPANTIVWLELIPFHDFGCRDTIPVKIKGEFTANFTISDTNAVCAPHSFTFYNTNLPSAAALWNFGDGTTASGDTVTHTYALPGTYIVNLEVELPSGCVGSVQKTVTILQPVGSFYFSGTYLCGTQQVQFDAVVSDADSLFWDFGDGHILPTVQTTVYHTYTQAGIYFPYLTVQSAFGCHNTLPGPDTIKIEMLRPGFYTTEQPSCGSTTVQFIDTSYSYFGITSYAWNFGDGTTGSGSNVSHTYTSSGTYTIRLTITGIGGCVKVLSQSIDVIVHNKPATTISGPTVACQSSTLTFTGNTTSSDPITFSQWTSSTGTTGTGTTFTVSFPQTGDYDIQYIVGTATGCRDTASYSVTVNPAPDVVQPADQSLCEGAATAAVNFTSSVAGTTYHWTNNNTLIGLASGGNGNIPSFTAVNNTAAPIVATITVTPTAPGNCTGYPKTFTITVNPTADVNQPANQALCANTATTAITFSGSVAGTVYNWTNSNTSIGLAASGTGNIPSFTAENNSTSPVSATITVTPVIGRCTGTPKTFTITVNPVAEVDQPADQSVCSGGAVAAIHFSGNVPGVVYSWTNSNSSIGLAASGTGDIASFNATNNTGAPITATITVSVSGTTCSGAPKTFQVTVNPTPALNQPSDEVVCDNTTVSAIVFTGSVAGTVYNWTNSNTSIGLPASGTGDIASFTAINNSNAPVTAVITVTPVIGSCNGTPKTFSITVNPVADVNQPTNQVICSGNSFADIHFSGSVPGTIYNWTNDNPAIGLAASGTGDITSFTATNNTGAPVTATITVSVSGSICYGASKTFQLTVNPTPSVNQPADISVCNNSTIPAIQFDGSVAATDYSWTNNNSSIGLAASGTGNIGTFTATNNGSVPATATITVSATAYGCNAVPKTFTITVNPVPDVDQPTDQALCNGVNTTAIHFDGTVNNTVYNWTNSNASIGLAASGTGDIASFTAINTSATAVTATITVTPSAYGCTGQPKTFDIIVNPNADMNQPADQVLCKNATSSPIVFTGPMTGAIYNWANSNTGIGLAANGTGDIPSFTAINNTTQPITATITVTANAGGCASPVKIFTITVNPAPQVTQPSDLTLCNGSQTQLIHFPSSVNGASISWTNDNTSIGLPASGSGDIMPFTVNNNADTTAVATITATATDNGCTGSPVSVTISVKPSPEVDQPADQSVCNGASTAIISFTSPVNGATFSWTNSNTSIGLAASGSGDIAPFVTINAGNTTETATITVVAHANGCDGPSKTFNINVNPSAGIDQPANLALCNGASSTAINFTGSVANTTYSWTNSNPAIGLAASGIGNIPVFIATNAGNTAATATITVSASSASGCSAPVKTFTISVKPTPTVNRPGDQTVCKGFNVSAINFTGPVSGTVYSWTNSNTSIGLAAGGTGNIPSFVGVNNGTTPEVATITVTPTANGCPGPDKIVTITVKPLPSILQPGNQALCNGSITAPITFTSSISGSTITWTNNTPSIGLAASGTGDIPAFPAVNNNDTTVTALIQVIASVNGCIGIAKSATITVNPTPDVDAGADRNVCQGSTTQLNASGAAQFSWSPSNGLSCNNCANPVANVSDSASYIVQGTSGAGCIAYDTVSLRVIKPFRMRVGPGDTLCVGESTHLQAMQANTYSWSPANGLNATNIAEPTATPQTTTLYQVVGYDAYHCFTDTAHILVNVGPKPTVEIGADVNASTGTVMTFHPVTSNGPIVSYTWTPATGLSCSDCATPTTTLANNIEYTVTVRNAYGCVATDHMRVRTFCKDGQVFIPNAFTPDGDGLNDILMVRGAGISVKSFRIFNRWGELVFEKTNFNPNDPKYGWDGKVRGVPATPDVFVYTAEVLCDNNTQYIYKGNITILK